MKESYYKQYEPIFGAWHMEDFFAEGQAEKHARRIFELTDRYFTQHSEEAAEELKTLHDQTGDYYQQGCAGYDGVMALHAHGKHPKTRREQLSAGGVPGA